MIIFEIDDVLADTSHRKQYIESPEDTCGLCYDYLISKECINDDNYICLCGKKPCQWKYNLEAYNAACVDDKPILPVRDIFHSFHCSEVKCQIWTNRMESLREQTIEWLCSCLSLKYCNEFCFNKDIKMRPNGNDMPIAELKEKWAKELCKSLSMDKLEFKRQDIDMVFASDPTEISMWRRHEVFVFDCKQGN